jgi:hypothetical protein
MTEDLRQYSWMPQSSEEQLSLGLELINFAYTNHNAALEEDIATLNAKIKELSAKLREAEDKVAESDITIQDLSEKNTKLFEENQRLILNLRKLKVDNARLQSLANHIKSTIDANESQPITFEPSKLPKQVEDTSSRNNNKAQQLINQIELSLQQPNLSSISRTNYTSKEGLDNLLTPSRVMEVGKRALLPRSSARISKVPRNYNEREHTQEFKNPLNEMYKSKIDEFKKSKVTGFESMLKVDKSSNQYEEGRTFFKEARKLLPFDKFNTFLREIKLLNKGQKTKDEVLKVAETLFTEENARMLEIFKQLILTSKDNDQFLN